MACFVEIDRFIDVFAAVAVGACQLGIKMGHGKVVVRRRVFRGLIRSHRLFQRLAGRGLGKRREASQTGSQKRAKRCVLHFKVTDHVSSFLMPRAGQTENGTTHSSSLYNAEWVTLMERGPLRKNAIAVAGPTGCGKSELALQLAGQFAGEVVNCDSIQIYRFFDIGAAKLREQDRRGIPHHLIDIANPDELFTAGDFARVGRPILDEIAARGHLPVVTGGTGFYLRALLDGLAPGPQRDEALRARLRDREARRPGSLHRLLRRFDPPTAARIHPNDMPKVMRALEI